jgi:hypothetical protein
VLSRNTRSYCLRFAALMSAASYVVVAVHAPVFLPISSIIFAASGMEECTNPRAAPSTSTLRGLSGLAAALSGIAAIILSTSDWQATRGLVLRPPHASGWPPAGGAGANAAATLVSPSPICCAVRDPLFVSSQSPNHLLNAPVNSSRVTEPSLLASTAAKIAGPMPPRPPPRPPPAA